MERLNQRKTCCTISYSGLSGMRGKNAMFRWHLRRRVFTSVLLHQTVIPCEKLDLLSCKQCKLIRVNTVIHAGPSGRAEIHNEKPISRLTHIPNHPKTANLKKRKRRRGKRASNPPKGHLRRQVLINY